MIIDKHLVMVTIKTLQHKTDSFAFRNNCSREPLSSDAHPLVYHQKPKPQRRPSPIQRATKKKRDMNAEVAGKVMDKERKS